VGRPWCGALVVALPGGIGLLAAAMLALTILAWRRRYWGVGRRAYYTTLTTAALAAAVWLTASGLMLPLLTRST
jgi:hypothetical protein